ncbi:lutropin-choriogonadotropic hormone receptor-like [Clavelina lepadiformis]|uniref:lutropin-choriogonadotropic hormone receptor-like n=1 Tax=Clavelina lepadiformis TaxID=159417 RepID=UPI0040423AD6
MFDNILFLWTTAALTALSVAKPTDSSPTTTADNSFENWCAVDKSGEICPHLHSKCCCEKTAINNELVVKCMDIEKIPPFPAGTHQLVLEKTKLKTLRQTSFNKTMLSTSLKALIIRDNKDLENIMARTFSGLHRLNHITIERNVNLGFIDVTAFSDLPKLSQLKIKNTALVDVEGFTNLETSSDHTLTIQMSENDQLRTIRSHAFANMTSKVLEVKITWNPNLELIEDYAFMGSGVKKLILNNNPSLRDISSAAFSGMQSLEALYLDNTPLKNLPGADLKKLKILSVKNTPNLVRIPESSLLPELREANLNYAFHCCALIDYGFQTVYENVEDNREKLDCETGLPLQEEGWGDVPISDEVHDESDDQYNADGLFYPIEYTEGFYDFDPTANSSSGDYYQQEPESLLNFPQGWFSVFPKTNSNSSINYGGVYDSPGIISESQPSEIVQQHICYRHRNGSLLPFVPIRIAKCDQKPDNFSPCENLLGTTALVIASWVVSWLAVFGNLFIVFMLLAITVERSRSHQRHLSAPKFLILNLAIADFCMGMYILALTVMDGKSAGRYYVFAPEWQMFGGCDVFGFFSIFASQLSIYTLSVISLERWYAIRFAIQLDKRMTPKCARIVMAVGWVACLILATLPLVGVNSYKKNAMCLPMDVESASGKGYAAAILILDVMAFLVVVGSYLSMYATVRSANGRQKTLPEVFRLHQKRKGEEKRVKVKKSERGFGVIDSRTADARVAKRMAVLVFIDFACFFPISFFSLFALAGLPLLTISTAKILLVVFYPLNACWNPFLYAILTKSFRQDVKTFIKSQKHACLYGDDRPKASSCKNSDRFQVEKRSEGGSIRQEERRKTIQVYVEGDAEKSNAEGGALPAEIKTTRLGKRPFSKTKQGINPAYSFSNSKSDSTVRASNKVKSNYNNNNNAKGANPRGSIKSNFSSRTASEETLAGRFSLFNALAQFGISIFKRKRNPSDTANVPAESGRHSFETQVTGNGATSVYDKHETDGADIDLMANKMVDTVIVGIASPDSDQHCEAFI